MNPYHYNGAARSLTVGQRTIRPATFSDSAFIWRLSMDPSVRFMSTRGAEFSFQEHEVWFNEKMTNAQNRFWILEVSDIPVGQVRYGRCEREAEIAISITPTERGKGYAKDLLLTTEPWAIDWLHIEKLVALVLRTNEASCRLFLAAGYRLAGTEERMDKSHWRFEKP